MLSAICEIVADEPKVVSVFKFLKVLMQSYLKSIPLRA